MYQLYLTNGAHLATVKLEHFSASLFYYRAKFDDRLIVEWRPV